MTSHKLLFDLYMLRDNAQMYHFKQTEEKKLLENNVSCMYTIIVESLFVTWISSFMLKITGLASHPWLSSIAIPLIFVSSVIKELKEKNDNEYFASQYTINPSFRKIFHEIDYFLMESKKTVERCNEILDRNRKLFKESLISEKITAFSDLAESKARLKMIKKDRDTFTTHHIFDTYFYGEKKHFIVKKKWEELYTQLNEKRSI